MKKIFAIALALVMVLSMASAFAYCPEINWACDTYTCTNGKGKVEVIPYVRGNACPGQNTYTPSNCAAAVNNDLVWAAIKVTVEADPSEDWWKSVDLVLSAKGMASYFVGSYTETSMDNINTAIVKGALYDMIAAADDDNEFKAGEYYIVADEDGTPGFLKAVKAADYEAEEATLWGAYVDDASKAKFCAKLVSEVDFTAQGVEINGYKVYYTKDATNPQALLTVVKGTKEVNVFVDGDDKIVKLTVGDKGATPGYAVSTYSYDASKFHDDLTDADFSWTCDDYGKFLKAAMDYFKFAFGTCITDKAVKANFGWDDKVESCFSWSANATAVVDAECVVAIPKTGDASVLAWLF